MVQRVIQRMSNSIKIQLNTIFWKSSIFPGIVVNTFKKQQRQSTNDTSYEFHKNNFVLSGPILAALLGYKNDENSESDKKMKFEDVWKSDEDNVKHYTHLLFLLMVRYLTGYNGYNAILK